PEAEDAPRGIRRCDLLGGDPGGMALEAVAGGGGSAVEAAAIGQGLAVPRGHHVEAEQGILQNLSGGDIPKREGYPRGLREGGEGREGEGEGQGEKRQSRRGAVDQQVPRWRRPFSGR